MSTRINPGVFAPEGIEPVIVHDHEFMQFSTFCDANGIGEHPDDWLPWFNCWMAGWIAGYES